MANTVFIVARKGVNHRHELAGAFMLQDDAEQLAIRCIIRECDDYHTYEVVALPLGHAPELVKAAHLREPFKERIPPVCVIRRDGDEVLVERSTTPIPW